METFLKRLSEILKKLQDPKAKIIFLDQLLKKAKDPEQRDIIKKLLAQVEKELENKKKEEIERARGAATEFEKILLNQIEKPPIPPPKPILEEEKIVSLAYVPISSKEKKSLGVIRIGSKTPTYFSPEQKNVLELIGNRIGVAIENAMLQERYIKSEVKYRTLFNSDPHPIFILDSKNFKILDMNQRAHDDYGYSRKELRQLTFLQLDTSYGL